jgi:pilus assembly protein CpaB
MRAYSFKVTDATGVGGHALPGDRVDVVLLRDLTPTGPERNYISYVVVQNARVLGIDLNADPSSDKPASPSTAILEVSVEESQKLALSSTLGTLSLALRKSGAAEIDDAPPLRTADFLIGGARPARVVRTSAPSAGPPRIFSGILIIEGAPSSSKRGGRARQSSAPAAPKADAAAAAATTRPATAGLDAIG